MQLYTVYFVCKLLYMFIIHLYTNKIALYFTLLKQYIKIVVLFKSPKNSPTCFVQFLTIVREIFIFFPLVTKDKLSRFVEACLLYLCFVLILRTLPSLIVAVQQSSNNQARPRWVDNIRMDLQEVGCGYMDWIGMAQDRDRWRTLVSAVMNFQFP